MSSRPRNVVRSLVASVAVGSAILAPAPAHAQSPEQVGLAQRGGFDCLTGEYFHEAAPDGFGTVRIHQTDSHVSATIKIRQGEPETPYVLRLVQLAPRFIDCSDTDLVFVTDAKGRANVQYSEALAPDAFAIGVVIDTRAQQGVPSWLGERLVPVT